jgi:hypothetical protein
MVGLFGQVGLGVIIGENLGGSWGRWRLRKEGRLFIYLIRKEGRSFLFIYLFSLGWTYKKLGFF